MALATGGVIKAPVYGGHEGGCEVVVPLHTLEAHCGITAELVACTLGQRRHADRLELRTDLAGRIMRAIHGMRSVSAWSFPR